MSDYPLLQKVMDHVTAHPEEHNQRNYGRQTPCGTTFCVAGHALLISGYTPLFTNYPGPEQVMLGVYDAHGKMIHGYDEVARKELDLTMTQASEIFYCMGELDEVWEVVERVTEGAVRRAP